MKLVTLVGIRSGTGGQLSSSNSLGFDHRKSAVQPITSLFENFGDSRPVVLVDRRKSQQDNAGAWQMTSEYQFPEIVIFCEQATISFKRQVEDSQIA